VTTLRDAIRAHLRAHPGAFGVELHEAIAPARPGLTRHRLRVELGKMVDDGLVAAAPAGAGVPHRGNHKRYTLVEAAPGEACGWCPEPAVCYVTDAHDGAREPACAACAALERKAS
jgi:hypothetical protein